MATSNQIKRINSTRSVPLRLATGGMLGTLAVGGVVAVGTQKNITLDVNGETVNLATFSVDVQGALKGAGVTVGDQDLVYPAPSENLANGETITVRTAKPVAVTIDGVQQHITSTAVTVDDLLGSLGNVAPGSEVKTAGSDLSSDDTKSEKLTDGMEVEVVSPKIVVVNDGGRVVYSKVAAKTVRDVLSDRGIFPDEDDRVTPSLDAEVTEGMYIKVDEVSTTDHQQTETFDAPANYVDDPRLEEGTEEVRVEGIKGERMVTRRLIMVDGAKESDDILSSTETKPAVPATIARGTKPKSRTASGTVWDSLAQCESTGNWSINTGNGFSGGLQFTDSTWKAFGGGAYAPQAWQASREQQIDVAQRVQAAQGWGAWPACTAKLGIG